MGLEVRRGRNGELLKIWYGAYTESNGKRRTVPLTEPFPVKHFPGSLKETGNAVFEASRARAKKELENFQTEARRKGRANDLTEKLIEAKTGRKVEYARLSDLPDLWRRLGRGGDEPGQPWLKWCDT
ncbi:MAG: hypothetical protein WCU90_10160, partial [Kiritimatiellia bacterium]